MRHEIIPINPDYNRAGAVSPASLTPAHTAALHTYILDQYPGEQPLRQRPAVLICPGGGYYRTSSREGEHIAIRYNALGFNAFVLKYSCAPAVWPAALLELAAAAALIRENAETWGIHPDKLYVSGFSAGGHLAASLGTLWNAELPCGPLLPGETFFLAPEENRDSLRPDGLVLSYPVITSGPFAHEGSFRNLLADRYDELHDFFSLENRVSADTPPTFLWHTFEDSAVPVENSLYFAQALRSAKVPFELHIYEPGAHGLSSAGEETINETGWGIQSECQGWLDLAAVWMKNSTKRQKMS